MKGGVTSHAVKSGDESPHSKTVLVIFGWQRRGEWCGVGVFGLAGHHHNRQLPVTTMKHLKSAAIMLCLAIGLAAVARAADVSIGYFDTIKNDPDIVAGKTYYLRHNLMFEKGTWPATNYWRGTLLPINTKVTVAALGNRSMLIKWDGGSLTVENTKFTRKTMAEIAKNMLSPNPVPIEKFGDVMAKNIASGVLVKGMTREQVIMTRGWPLGDQTPGVMSDNARWVYATSNFVKETMVISDGKLVAGRNVLQ